MSLDMTVQVSIGKCENALILQQYDPVRDTMHRRSAQSLDQFGKELDRWYAKRRSEVMDWADKHFNDL